MRKIDYITVFLCAIAAALCGAGSNFSAPVFVLSSGIGLVDSMKNKVISASLINGIFLTLNIYCTIKNFF